MSYKTDHDLGYEEGAICNRGWLYNCPGKLKYTEIENCSCHLGHAPCASCTSVYLYCPVCDWNEKDGYE